MLIITFKTLNYQSSNYLFNYKKKKLTLTEAIKLRISKIKTDKFQQKKVQKGKQ